MQREDRRGTQVRIALEKGGGGYSHPLLSNFCVSNGFLFLLLLSQKHKKEEP